MAIIISKDMINRNVNEILLSKDGINRKIEEKYQSKDNINRKVYTKDKKVYLFKDGDECTNITGGWDNYIKTCALPSYWSGGYFKAEKLADHIRMYAKGTRIYMSLGTNNQIDMSNFKYLKVSGTLINTTSNGGADVILCTKTDDQAARDDKYDVYTRTLGNFTLEVDITGAGSKYIFIEGCCHFSPLNEVIYRKVWLE